MSQSVETVSPVYSVVIPIYNEAELLTALHQRVTQTLQQFHTSYEVIYVDDGSSDRSVEILRELCAREAQVTAISLSRNFGHQTAISAGLWYARGERVVVMDGDLQDPPEMIAELAAKYEEGFDVVYGVRRSRKESWGKRLAYRVFYRLLRLTASVEMPLDAGDFCLMSRRVVDLINQMPERNRFVRGLRSWVGLRQVGVSYERQHRFAGRAKYTLGKLWRLSLDGLLSFSYAPLRLALYLGLFVCIVSFVGIIVVVWWRISTNSAVAGYASLAIGILFLGGLQLLTIGVIGEYVGRIFDEVKQRPQWVLREVIGQHVTSELGQPGEPVGFPGSRRG